jgi:hypothetical protein
MTDIQVTLVAEQNFGDHGALVRTAHLAEPGETVEHLLHRLMRAGEFARPYMNPESPSSWIEIRYVDGTLPKPEEPSHAPF